MEYTQQDIKNKYLNIEELKILQDIKQEQDRYFKVYEIEEFIR